LTSNEAFKPHLLPIKDRDLVAGSYVAGLLKPEQHAKKLSCNKTFAPFRGWWLWIFPVTTSNGYTLINFEYRQV